MHEIVRKNVNESIHIFMQIFTSFYEGQLKQQIFYSFIQLIFYMVFNPFKMAVQFIKAASNFPTFAFLSQIQ